MKGNGAVAWCWPALAAGGRSFAPRRRFDRQAALTSAVWRCKHYIQQHLSARSNFRDSLRFYDTLTLLFYAHVIPFWFLPIFITFNLTSLLFLPLLLLIFNCRWDRWLTVLKLWFWLYVKRKMPSFTINSPHLTWRLRYVYLYFYWFSIAFVTDGWPFLNFDSGCTLKEKYHLWQSIWLEIVNELHMSGYWTRKSSPIIDLAINLC